MMTRKDYKLIASAFYAARPCASIPLEQQTATQLAATAQWEQCVERIASALVGTNDLYSKSKFIAACRGE